MAGRVRSCSSTACRTRTSSAIATLLEDWQASGSYPVTYLPTVSRPDDPRNARAGRAGSGRVEAILGPVLDELELTAANSIAYICGNPDMILAAEATLLERGYPEEQVHKELYWPKGKEPRGVAAGGPRRRDRGRRGERGPVGRRASARVEDARREALAGEEAGHPLAAVDRGQEADAVAAEVVEQRAGGAGGRRSTRTPPSM